MYRAPSLPPARSLVVGRKRSKSSDDDESTPKRRPHRTPERTSENDEEERYITLKIIKWGSFGAVSKVKHRDDPTQIYACKQLNLRTSGLKIVQNEVNLIRKVRHRHMVQVIDAFADKASSLYHIILHPLADSDLRKYLDDTAALSFRDDAHEFGNRRLQLLGWMSCLAGALCCIHSHNVRHRDIKPENILIYGTNILFTDFGTSYHSEQDTRYTVTKTPSTEKYAPPEASGKRRFGRRGDIFSLGCVVFEMLDALSGPLLITKRLPQIGSATYASANICEILMRDRDEIREHPYRKRHLYRNYRLCSDFPRSLLLLISDMLDSVPENRCTAEEAVCDVNKILKESDLMPMDCCTVQIKEAKSQKQRLLKSIVGPNSPKQLIVAIAPVFISKLIVDIAIADQFTEVTVVIMPTAIAPIDILQRLKCSGIEYLCWESWEVKTEPFVFVSAEAACTDSFLEYTKRLQNERSSVRVIVNDCDPFLAVGNCTLSSQISKVQRQSQTVWLATTPSERWLQQIQQTCFIDPPTLIWAETHRENIKYSVEGCRSWDELWQRTETLITSCVDPIKQVAGGRNTPATSDDKSSRVLVCCATQQLMDRLVARLGHCHIHTANFQMVSRLHRDRAIAAWIAPTASPVLVVTGPADFGLDYPHVKWVIHVGEPHSMEVFTRESGRAGRDGARAESIVLLGPTEDTTPRSLKFSYDLSEQQRMKLYLSRKYCLRALISKYLDETSSCSQCILDDELCSVCEEFEAEQA